MKRKYISIIIVLIIVSLLITAFFIFKQKKSSSSENPPNNIVGGDKDQHGCIGSAGYSWCETKGKCLRTWEEACDETINKSCGIQNCNGLNIVCGPNPVETCPAIYQIGDVCRQYARCSINKDGICREDKTPQFADCKECVERCLRRYDKDQVKMSDCESLCSRS